MTLKYAEKFKSKVDLIFILKSSIFLLFWFIFLTKNLFAVLLNMWRIKLKEKRKGGKNAI